MSVSFNRWQIFIIMVGMLLCFTGCFEGSDTAPNETLAGTDFVLDKGLDQSGSISLKSHPGNADRYDVISEKNLFHKDRNYVPADNEETEPDKPSDDKPARKVDLPNLKLVGTISMSASESYAFIIDTKDRKLKNKIQKFKLGDWIGDYRITGINADHVAFKKGDELALLKLKAAEGKAKSRSRASRNNSRTGTKNTQKNARARTSDKDKEKQKEAASRRNSSRRSVPSRGNMTSNMPNKSQSSKDTGRQENSGSRGRTRADSCGR